MSRIVRVGGRLMDAEVYGRECSFRRGYQHAVEAAILSVRQGVSVEQLEEWGDRIEAWRERRTDAMLPPDRPFPTRA